MAGPSSDLSTSYITALGTVFSICEPLGRIPLGRRLCPSQSTKVTKNLAWKILGYRDTQTDNSLSPYKLMATTGRRGRSHGPCVNPHKLRLLQVGVGDLDPGVSSLRMLQALRISFRKAGEGCERDKYFIWTLQVFF